MKQLRIMNFEEMKSFKDFKIGSSLALFRLETEPDLAECVDLAINALLRSAHDAEGLAASEWHPDTLTLRDKGIP